MNNYSPHMWNDAIAMNVVAEWQKTFPDAAALPGIGLPSQSKSKSVLTMTHTMGANYPPLTINGLPSQSPLANNALLSAEITQNTFLNLYEIMIPDIPGTMGAPSSGEIYTEFLWRNGIRVEGDHYHWKGSRMMGYFPLAIHSEAVGMHPLAFARIQAAALREAF